MTFSYQSIFSAMALPLVIAASFTLLFIFLPARRQGERKPPFAPGCAGVIWVVAGVLMASVFAGMFTTALDSRSWPEVEATITYYHESPKTDDDGNFDGYDITAKVRYEFDGQQYEDVSLSTSDRDKQVGSRVSVRVNPGAPRDIVNGSASSWMLASAIFFAIGLAVYIPGILCMRKGRLYKQAQKEESLR